jgi:hypothetical protein
MDHSSIEKFVHAQAKAWNSGDKAAFLEAYSSVAPNGLEIEYVGRPAADGWPVLEAMWDQQNSKVEVESIATIVNAGEAACHNRNWIRGTQNWIETIELFRFDSGRLKVRYFIQQSSGGPGRASAAMPVL